MFSEAWSLFVNSLSELKPVFTFFLEALSGKYGLWIALFVALGLISFIVPVKKGVVNTFPSV